MDTTPVLSKHTVAHMRVDKILPIVAIPHEQRAHIHRTVRFRESGLEGEAQWVEQYIKLLEGQQLESPPLLKRLR